MSRRLVRTIILLPLLIAVATTGCAKRDTQDTSAEMRAAVKADIAQVMADIDAADSMVKVSSNPYDYVGVSPAFDRLVDRGKPALDSIAAEIESSPENGLREYLLAIAGGRIMGETGQGATGKDWAAWYRTHK